MQTSLTPWQPTPPVPPRDQNGNPQRVPKPSRAVARRAELAGSTRDTPTPSVLSKALLFFFGIFLPAITLLVEAVNHMCAESFFDPLPTVGHVFAIAAVPLANGAALWTLRRGGGARVEAMIFAQAIAVAIAGVYTVMFLPITAMAIEALAFAGLGLLPLSPLLSLIASARALAALRRLHPALTRPARRVVLGGLAGGLVHAD